jgi:hypothetical protein
VISSRLLELEREVSRRGFLSGVMRGTGIISGLGTLAGHIAAAETGRPKADGGRLPYRVLSAIGQIVIPVDQDPGWETFEPGITDFALDVFVGQVFLNGNETAIGGFKDGLELFNSIPISIAYDREFLEMIPSGRAKYFSDILTRQFENDGAQELLDFIFILSLVATKAVFFSNYPRHRAQVGAEYQIIPPSSLRTGWDIMRWKGPVGPEEEAALREKFIDTPVAPGVDRNNPYI